MDFGALFQNATQFGVQLSVIVMALVQWIKGAFPSLGGTAVRVVSLAVGLVIGICYQMATAMPSTFAGWFSAVIFGLLLGMFASGLYDSGSGMAANYGK